MWSALRWLLLRIAAVRWLFKLFSLGLLLPIALLLKTIGLPVLIVLGILGLPILLLLFVFGLPIILVLVFGGMLMAFLAFVLTLGIAAIKITLLVVLPAWLIWKVVCMVRGKRGGGANGDAGGSPGSSTGPATGPVSDPADGLDPA